jgi:WD40 repeat protein
MNGTGASCGNSALQGIEKEADVCERSAHASSAKHRGTEAPGNTPSCTVCGGCGHGKGNCVVLGAALHSMTNAKADVVDIILQFLCDWNEACFDQEIRCVSYGPRIDAIAAGERGGGIQLVCARTGEKSLLGRAHTGHVHCLAWSPCGKMLASGGDDQMVYIWDGSTVGVANGINRALVGHQSGVTSVAWSPSAQKLATSSYDETVRIWSSQSGVCESTMSGHTRAVTSVSWGRDGATVVSSSDDKTAKIWVVTASGQGTLDNTLSFDGSVSCVGFSPCGSKLATACNDGYKDVYCIKILCAERLCGRWGHLYSKILSTTTLIQ